MSQAGYERILARYRVALVGTMYAGNVGSVARLCTNYAVGDVRVVSPACAWKEGEALIYAREHSRAVLESFGEHADLPSALEGCQYAVGFSGRRGDLRNPNVDVDGIHALSKRGRVALVFGSEQSGLSTEQILHCTHICSLPTAPLMPSLNLSHAVAVVVSRLFQLSYDEILAEGGLEPAAHFTPGGQEVYKSLSPTMERLLAPVALETFEALVGHLRSVMVAAGLTEQGNPDRILADIRRMLQRASLTERDANILHGVLQAIDRTFRKGTRLD